ncbi:hypothetical protein ABG067_007912, partial [Albugo candida]
MPNNNSNQTAAARGRGRGSRGARGGRGNFNFINYVPPVDERVPSPTPDAPEEPPTTPAPPTANETGVPPTEREGSPFEPEANITENLEEEPTEVVLNNSSNWTFLQIMLGIHNRLLREPDNLVKNAIWTASLNLFKDEMRNDSSEPENVIEAFTVRKMQNKWNYMKTKYNTLRSRLQQTGIGGEEGNRYWQYYDEVGQICRFDESIHPPIVVESQSRNGNNPIVVDNTDNIDMSEEEYVELGVSRARRRGTKIINRATIDERIFSPSGRYEGVEEHNNRDDLPSTERPVNQASQGGPTEESEVTGSGRETRARVTDANRLENLRTLLDEQLGNAYDRFENHQESFIDWFEERDDRIADRLISSLDAIAEDF